MAKVTQIVTMVPSILKVHNNIQTAPIGQVCTTTSYGSLLKNWNRSRDPVDIARVKDSITKMGQLVPAIITRDFYLVDGGHRVHGCKDLGIPVIYVRMHYDFSELLMIEINSNLKKWNWRDYITMNIHRNIAGWKGLYSLMVKYDITYTTAVDLGFATGSLFNKGLPIIVDYAALEREIKRYNKVVGMAESLWDKTNRRQDIARALRITHKAVKDSNDLSANFKYSKVFKKMMVAGARPKRMPESCTDYRVWIQNGYNWKVSVDDKTTAIAG